jgi:hypothetical protein
MIIKADGKTIRDGDFTMRQALHIANNTGECLTAKRLEIINDGINGKEAKATITSGDANKTADNVGIKAGDENETADKGGVEASNATASKADKKKRGK